MIARSWDGLTAAERADDYAEYVRRTGVAELASTAGNRGVFLLRRREGAKARFRVLSLWDTMDGIRRFAGDDAERARYYPEDARYLESLAPHVEHFEVLAQGATAPAGTDGAELAHEVETLAEGDPWHGPPLAEVLDGVTAEAASARPLAGAHTIWELVLHITAWNDVMRRRLEGTAVEEPEAGDFPAPPAPTAAAWAQAKDALFAEHRKLAALVARLSAGDLRRPVPGRSYDTFFQVRSAIRHTVYHTGQIGLLRKATLR